MHNFPTNAHGPQFTTCTACMPLQARLDSLTLAQIEAKFREAGAAGTVFSSGSSQHRGVGWHKGSEKWVAQLRVNGTNIFLGCFKEEDDAARAYDAGAFWKDGR